MTNTEIRIKILEALEKSVSKQRIFQIRKEIGNDLEYPDLEKLLSEMEEDKLIKIDQYNEVMPSPSEHTFVTVVKKYGIRHEGLDYLSRLRSEKPNKIKAWIESNKTIITVSISLIAIILAGIKLYIELFKDN